MMDQETLLDLLRRTIHHEMEKRIEAEQKLCEFRDTNLGLFIQSVSSVLANNAYDATVRQIAGITLKNTISSSNKRDAIDEERRRWLALPPEITNPVQQQVLMTIQSPYKQVSNAACQVLSKLGLIELPENRWPDFLESLLKMVTGMSTDAKRASLTCLGYLCEEMAEVMDFSEHFSISAEQKDKIITTVAQGMIDTDPAVKVAALQAFYHCILFAQTNFRQENEQAYIMQILLDSCKHEDEDVRAKAFECLLQVVTEYYEFMKPYMDLLYSLTVDAINEGSERIAIPAIEFWNSICDEEIRILDGDSSRESQQFIILAQSRLLPILLETLTKQESEDEDVDAWTLAKSAAICVSLCAVVTGADILPPLLTFVSQNFSSEDWKRREAALLAYGSVMDAVPEAEMHPIINSSFLKICQSLRDHSEAVRDTAAWTIGRMMKFQTGAVLPHLGDVNSSESPINIILDGLKDKPRVAVNVCWIIHELYEGADGIGWSTWATKLADGNTVNAVFSNSTTNNPLDTLFQNICSALLAVSERQDADERGLRKAALRSLITVIHTVGDAMKPAMYALYEHFLQLLEASLVYDRTPQLNDLQGLICGCLQVLLTRIGTLALPLAPRTWKCFVNILGTSASAGMAEDAFLAISAFVNVLDGEFHVYMRDLVTFLLLGLHRTDEPSTCKVCIELVSDVSRAMQNDFAPYSQSIMMQLHSILKDNAVDRRLKPGIMIAVGDVAMAITSKFDEYLLPFMQLLTEAARILPSMGPMDDPEWTQYIEDLREGVLQAYSGIVYGMKDGGKAKELRPYVTTMLEIVQLVVDSDPSVFSSSQNFASAIALTGDLANTYGRDICQTLQSAPFICKMLQPGEIYLNNHPNDWSHDIVKKSLWLRDLMNQHCAVR